MKLVKIYDYFKVVDNKSVIRFDGKCLFNSIEELLNTVAKHDNAFKDDMNTIDVTEELFEFNSFEELLEEKAELFI